MSDKREWCLHNLLTELRLSGLTLDEVRLVTACCARKERFNWLLWKESWPAWRPLTQVPEALEAYVSPLPLSPPDPSQLEEDEEHEIQRIFSGSGPHSGTGRDSEMDLEPAAQSDVELEGEQSGFVTRLHPRKSLRLPVAIECNGRIFKTHTINLSGGGALLEEPLPDWIVGYCQITIRKSGDNNMRQLTCAVVENQNPQKRLRVEFKFPDDNEALAIAFERWLAA